MLEKFKKSLAESDIVKRGHYDYFVNPFTSGVPAIEPEIINEICAAILSEVGDKPFDVILTAEAMGIHIAAVLSQMTGIPFNIVRKKEQQTSGEIKLEQVTGYSRSDLYMTIPEKSRVLFIDSVISTGGTVLAIMEGLKSRHCEIVDIIMVIERGEGIGRILEESGYNVKSLVNIDVKNGKVIFLK